MTARRRRRHSSETLVNLAFDRYHADMRGRGIDAPSGCRALTLAGLVHVRRERMSIALASYREIQGVRPTKYVVACREYGLNARWNILARPGDDPHAVQEARKTARIWSAQDTAKRLTKDVVHELTPGMHDTEQDRICRHADRLMQSTVTNMVEFVSAIIHGE